MEKGPVRDEKSKCFDKRGAPGGRMSPVSMSSVKLRKRASYVPRRDEEAQDRGSAIFRDFFRGSSGPEKETPGRLENEV